MLGNLFGYIRSIPIIGDLGSASWPDWREALKEVFIILLFSLMPLWLGLLAVELLTITDNTANFVTRFASSSDLGILSTSLLGPLLYMMFRDEGRSSGNQIVPRFPSGLWFITIIIAACVVATVIYSFTYLSTIGSFFNESGVPIKFVNPTSVATTSWTLFGVSIALILSASAIRNSLESQPANMMSADTENFVSAFRAAQEEQQ